MKLNFKAWSLFFAFAAVNINAQESQNSFKNTKYSTKKAVEKTKKNNQDDVIFSKDKLLNWMKNHKKTTALIVASPVIIYGLNELKKEVVKATGAGIFWGSLIIALKWINNGYKL